MSLQAAAIYKKPGLVRDVRNSNIRDVRNFQEGAIFRSPARFESPGG
jgi:hypothetical protein